MNTTKIKEDPMTTDVSSARKLRILVVFANSGGC